MLRHFLITAFRHYYRTRVFSFVNIAGLSIGVSIALLLLTWIHHESSYDRFHKNGNRIYRIIAGMNSDSGPWSGTPAPLAGKLASEIPEIESYVRMINMESILQANGKTFNEERVFPVDSSFFNVFSFELLSGDRENVLNDLYSVVLSASLAQKYFGNQDPTGQTIRFDSLDFKVTGVAADPPANSHFHFDALVRFDLFYEKLDDQYLDCWGCYNFKTYLLLNPLADPESVTNKIHTITVNDEGTRSFNDLDLQPLRDIHYSTIRGNFEPEFNKKYLVIYWSLILIILAMASVNYINLSVAIAPVRYKEVGIKKTFGANRNKLTVQFILESVLATLIAFFIAIILTEIFQPYFNRLVERDLNFKLNDPGLFGLFLLSAVLLGILIGIYPSRYTSAAPVIRILSGKALFGKHSMLRNGLVIFQFTVSIVFIFSALVLNKQMHFMRNQNPGFDREHVINISFFPTGIQSKEDLLKYQSRTEQYKSLMENNTRIAALSINNFVPSKLNRNHSVSYEGQTEDKMMNAFVISGDRDFCKTFNIELIAGKNEIEKFSFNGTYGYILNESAVDAIGWDQPLDKNFSIFGPDTPGKVLGVCRDFHYRSFHHKIGPCVIILGEPGTQVSARLTAGSLGGLLTQARKDYEQVFPDSPFEYFFADEDFDRLYKTEIKTTGAITSITFLSILIAGLGLYGLASFYTVQRTKEIGIRKVMGAGKIQIIYLFLSEIGVLMAVAIMAGIPVSLVLANNWLSNFAYRTAVNWWLIPLAGLIIMLISSTSIGYQTLKAACKNPVNTLRYE